MNVVTRKADPERRFSSGSSQLSSSWSVTKKVAEICGIKDDIGDDAYCNSVHGLNMIESVRK
jgi:hypothetical protein